MNLLSALNFARTKATGAYANGGMSSVNNSLYLTDIGLPGSVSLAVGVGNVMSKGNALAADGALCHFDTSKIPSIGRYFI